jgi:hypothetical protein
MKTVTRQKRNSAGDPKVRITMTVIRQEDFIASVAGALQYISYYHPVDYIAAWPRPTSASSPTPPKTPWRRSSSTAACAPRAIAPSARTPASSTPSSKWAWMSASKPAPGEKPWTCSRWSTKACAAPISTPTTSSAPPAGRPRGQARQHQRQHARRGQRGTGARLNRRSHRRGQRRRL